MLSNTKLDELAGRLHGWVIEDNSWIDETGERMHKVTDYAPTEDHNQSHELMEKCAERGAVLTMCFGEGVNSILGSTGRGKAQRVPGNSARSQVIACLLAWDAMEEAK